MESTAVGIGAQDAQRSIAEIESDLTDAEIAFKDAHDRLEQAMRERSAALEKINRCQTEFDDVVKARRQNSTAGTKWHEELEKHGQSGKQKDDLVLSPEDELEEASPPPQVEGFQIVTEEFNRLRNHVRSQKLAAQ